MLYLSISASTQRGHLYIIRFIQISAYITYTKIKANIYSLE